MSIRDKSILGSLLALIIIAVASQLLTGPASSITTPSSINVTLLTNAGIMIETGDTRIYIDPIDLPQDYRTRPADAILITHNHGDHYQYATINMLQKEDTVNVFPVIMDAEINRHDGTGVVPRDTVMVGDIKVTAYYMYTTSPDGVAPASHPAESMFTSYIIDIDGFTLFHAGDSKNIPEYTELTDTINVAMLPLGPGCQTMYGDEVVEVIQLINPDYFIPIHYTETSYRQFNVIYKRTVESTTECTVCSLENYSTYSFQPE